MANALPDDVVGAGVIIELGAGTGPVTAALLRRGVPPSDLYVVEKQPQLAKDLTDRFPEAHVLCCGADEVTSVVDGPARAIVSSLPFRSLPHDVCVSISREIERALAPGGLYVQFTYALFGDLPFAPDGFEPVTSSIVWPNIPPAKVVVLRKPA